MIVFSPTKLKKGTTVLRRIGVDYEELKIIFVEKNKVILDDGTILKKDKIKWQGKYDYDKKKWEWYWKAPKSGVFAIVLKNKEEGDFIKTYDETEKLISMKLKEPLWFTQSHPKIMELSGYSSVSKKSIKDLDTFYGEGSFLMILDWFGAACYDNEKADDVIKWMVGPLKEIMIKREITKLTISQVPFHAPDFGMLVEKVVEKAITATMGKVVLDRMFDGEKLDDILKDDAFKITSSDEVEGIVDRVLEANPDQVGELKAGKEKILMWLVGQVMKASRGKANAAEVKEMIKEKLDIS